MPTIQRLINSFIAISPTGKVQSAHDTPMAQADLDMQLKCTVTREAVITRERILDCNGRFLDSKPKLTQMYRWTWNFASVKPQILALLYSYFGGAALSPTGTPADEAQTLSRTGTVSGGTFTISLTVEGKTGITAPIPYDATALAIQTAILKNPGGLGNLLKQGDVVVTGDWTTGIVLTFGGRYAKADLALVTIDNTSITGGGTIARVQTTAGANKYHALSNSAADAKAEFSFVCGFKTGSLPIEEFYNAVIERFEPTLNRNGNVSLTVSVLSNYEPVVLTGYSIPVCENYAPLKTAECSISIDGEWKTRDISSLNVSLNDNIPVDADVFGFDSENPEQFERGDQPSYTINGSVFGSPNDTSDNFAVAVRNEETVDTKIHFGFAGNRFSLVAPQTIFNPAGNDRQFAGSRNRSVIAFEGEPSRNGSAVPVTAEATISQTTAFLTV